jgi:hypothetical protein
MSNLDLAGAAKRAKNTHIFARDPLDFYVEPDWVSAALFRSESFRGPIIDPACGFGRIVTSAVKAGHHAQGSDIVRRSPMCDYEADFFAEPPHGVANICSNPPFSRAQEFAQTAIRTARRKVALLRRP